MASPFLVLFFVFFAFNSVLANSCGGLLEGERGHFSHPNGSNQEKPGSSNSSCLWIIQLHYKANIRLTLDDLRDDLHLSVYPEGQLTSCNVSDYTKLNSTHVGSSFEFPGKTLIIIIPNTPASIAFSWEFFGENSNSSSVKMTNADYVNSPNGLLEWEQLETVERVTWAINSNKNLNIRWNVDVDVALTCDAAFNCACFHFAILELTSAGVLSEAVRTCHQSSEGILEGISGRAVVLINVNTKVEANKISVSWESDDVTEPPVSSATGLFAATTTGLIALDLQTLATTNLTIESTFGVAVNDKLRKVYWSQGDGNSSIWRSNLDGSSKETIVQPTGDYIHMLAVDEASGNIYFALFFSQEITVCNALGKDCAAVISNSSLVNHPAGIALDTENRVMYWGNQGSRPHFIVRADLDGCNATIISTGFNYLQAITLLQPTNDVLYWADYGANTIGSIDVNGDSHRTLVELVNNPRPRGVQADGHKVYIGNWLGKNIQSFDRDSGELRTIFDSVGFVRHLALFTDPMKQEM